MMSAKEAVHVWLMMIDGSVAVLDHKMETALNCYVAAA